MAAAGISPTTATRYAASSTSGTRSSASSSSSRASTIRPSCSRATGTGTTRPCTRGNETLADRRRRHGRAGRALDPERLQAEGELVDLLRRELVELQVFHDMHAVHHQEDLVSGQAQVLVRVGGNLHRPVVGAD